MVLTPQLLQAIKLLQMPNAELSAFIESELEQNPLLERNDTPAESAAGLTVKPEIAGPPEGLGLGAPEGLGLGAPEGLGLGAPDGLGLGAPDGLGLGAPDGLGLGAPDGLELGAPDGPGGTAGDDGDDPTG